MNAVAPESPRVNSNIAELYGREAQRLTNALANNPTSGEAVVALRSLIGDVVLMPGERRVDQDGRQPHAWLIEQRQCRFRHQGPADGKHLLLPSGEVAARPRAEVL